MPRQCTVCSHKRRKQIEAALMGGVPIRKVAESFNVGYGSVNRHKTKCVTLAISTKVKTLDKKEVEKNVLSGSNILKKLEKLTTNLDDLRKKAAEDKQYSASIAAVKEQIRMGENLLQRAESLKEFEETQGNKDSIYKEDLPGEIKQMVNTILNDPDLERDEVEAEYEYVSES